ncbi:MULTISPECIES: alpha/beta hydrolase [unclassified Streptomyces]|uniref:alpha/beta hydrolase n=1 Tax=unclassified Streptomyces TaxID=2593676 RepID=UPI0011CD79FB|nr:MULTISPECIES: alpha/beta hydrolase [unclassified Streptomyces]TXS66519.1 alpha/beta fold hydrolase [Streptomyces sp. me109]
MYFRRILRPLRRGGMLLAATTLLVSACSSGSLTTTASEASASHPTASSPKETGAVLAPLPDSTPAALTSYYEQKPTWRSCGAPGFECTTMKVPLDYDDPASGAIKLAVARKKATGPGKRIGSLLVNPGGPGGSAVGYLQSYAGLGYPAKIRARYDMVAVDPRGVARSEPIECLSGPEMDTFTKTDMTPDNVRETDELVEAYKKFAEGCARHSPKVLRHVSTVETARDMDIVRAALGDQKLNYVGASYGTFLGATYAGLYPRRVGRMVLDGALDPSIDARTLNKDQTAGFETAFQSFAKDCVRHADCPLGGRGTSPGQVGKNLSAFFKKLDSNPIPTGDPDRRQLTESLATTGVIAAMYDQSAWPQLREALGAAMKDKDGAGLLALSDSYYERDAKGHYTNLMFANAAVNCLDLPSAFSGPGQLEKSLPAFEKASPVFGEGLAWAALNCAYWPVKPTGEPHRIEAKGAGPILVVGTTRDPATPYAWAQSLAGQLSSATLLTYVGDGHTAYGRGSTCIDSAINGYLLDGTPPPRGKRCS